MGGGALMATTFLCAPLCSEGAISNQSTDPLYLEGRVISSTLAPINYMQTALEIHAFLSDIGLGTRANA